MGLHFGGEKAEVCLMPERQSESGTEGVRELGCEQRCAAKQRTVYGLGTECDCGSEHWRRLFRVVPDTDFSELRVSGNSPISFFIHAEPGTVHDCVQNKCGSGEGLCGPSPRRPAQQPRNRTSRTQWGPLRSIRAWKA